MTNDDDDVDRTEEPNITPEQMAKAFSTKFAQDLFTLVSVQHRNAQSAGLTSATAMQAMSTECLYMAAKIVAQASGMSVDNFLHGARMTWELAKKHQAMTPDPAAKPN